MKVNEHGIEIYETLDDFKGGKIGSAFENDEKYYLSVDSGHEFDERRWVIDKRSRKVVDCIHEMDFGSLLYDDQIVPKDKLDVNNLKSFKQVDPETIDF